MNRHGRLINRISRTQRHGYAAGTFARTEYFDFFAAFGEVHLRHTLIEHAARPNHQHPPQPSGNRPPPGADPPGPAAVVRVDGMGCEGWRGGVLGQYRRRAA
jgi:hypothetical protein